MKLHTYFIGTVLLLSATTSFSQTKDLHVAANVSTAHPAENKMNRMKIERLLTDKQFNTLKGHDAYRLKDGMICLTPDSTVSQKLIVLKPKDNKF